MAGWALSAALAVGAVALLASFRFIHDFEAIGLALTTTALGTLLPILHGTKTAGRPVRAVRAGRRGGGRAVPDHRDLAVPDPPPAVHRDRLAARPFGLTALLLTTLPRIIGDQRLRALIRQGRRATAQTTLRWAIVLLIALLVAARSSGSTWCSAPCWPASCCVAGPGG